MVAVSSSAISDLDYDEASGNLTITFKRDGARYTYHGVSQADYAALVYAMSHGRTFNLNIRDSYAFSRG